MLVQTQTKDLLEQIYLPLISWRLLGLGVFGFTITTYLPLVGLTE
jgi:hypothetical protein